MHIYLLAALIRGARPACQCWPEEHRDFDTNALARRLELTSAGSVRATCRILWASRSVQLESSTLSLPACLSLALWDLEFTDCSISHRSRVGLATLLPTMALVVSFFLLESYTAAASAHSELQNISIHRVKLWETREWTDGLNIEMKKKIEYSSLIKLIKEIYLGIYYKIRINPCYGLLAVSAIHIGG